MPKQLVFNEEAREKLINGVNIVAKAVVTTLGPKGRNVAIESEFGSPKVLHDGVSVAKEIVLSNKFENMGAQLIKQASIKTNEQAGDGTTTATLLTHALVTTGMKYIVSGTNPMIMKKGIDKAVKIVVEEIKKLSKPVKKSDWEKVATISAQNAEIGKKITEALEMIGQDGLIEVENGHTDKIVVKHKKGMTFDKGYANHLFARGNEDGVAEVKNPYILVIDKKLNNMTAFVVFLEEFIKVSKDLVIIASDIDVEVMSYMVANKLKGILNVSVVKAPGFGDRQKETMRDVAIIVGAELVSDELGIDISEIKGLHLGRADLIKSTKDETVIVGGKGNEDVIAERITLINTEIKNETSAFEIEKLEERKARLVGGVASIQVGAPTESEIKNLVERVKDAKGATKSAIKEGIIPGGGIAFIRAIKALKDVETSLEDEKIGIKLVEKVLQEPIRTLASNSGYDAGWVSQSVLNHEYDKNYGFNVLNGKFGDMIKMGVIEPTLVATASLINASSVAGMILTTECLIANEDEKTSI